MNQVIWIKGKKQEKSHKLAEKSVSRKKKVKGKCACCFGSKFSLSNIIPVSTHIYYDTLSLVSYMTSLIYLFFSPKFLCKDKNNKNNTSWQKNQCLGKKKWKESLHVVLAQNLFYNWCLFYTNPGSEISIEN